MQADGEDIPEYDSRPLLYPDLHPEYRAFLELSSQRPAGFGVGAIPFSEIKAYMEIHGIFDDSDYKLLFLHRVTFLDSVYLEFHAEKARREAKNRGKNHPEH